MNRVRNANQFRLEFRRIIARYEETFRPQIVRLREKYASNSEEERFLDESLLVS